MKRLGKNFYNFYCFYVSPSLILFISAGAWQTNSASPPLTVRKKIPLKVSPLFVLLHQVKTPDDLHQRLGQRYCLKASAEFHQHWAFLLFLSMTCTSWPWRAESASASMAQMNSSGTGDECASWLHCPRRVSCLLKLDERQKNCWQHLHWLHWSCFQLGFYSR